MPNSLLKKLLAPFFIVLMICISYVALFYNDAVVNISFLREHFGNQFLWIFNVALVILVIPVSLQLMELITGEFGLERFKRIAAISMGMTTLSFAALQFIGAIATSSAEGATVVVEVIQQIAHFSQHMRLEEYGLVGMLTSDASGPWNSSIFPLLIFIVWFLRRKQVGLETKQLHIPMIFQWILYAQQFLFALDLKYTLLEIILMGITGTIFVWGMISFMVSMFKDAEKAESTAAKLVKENGQKEKKKFWYSRFISWISHLCFSILIFNPLNKKVNTADNKVKNKRGGFGQIGQGYVVANALQLTIAMTVAMFALVLSVQFLAAQFHMSDAEAALFGTAGLTSAPEAFVALAVGPYINALLLVGSNIIDGWMSAIGQTVLLSYAEIASSGQISSIPLHPAIRFLTFLSWTQGMFVWLALGLYAHKINRAKNKTLLTLATIIVLGFAIVYYFGGAWFSAQALGYGAEYAKESVVFKTLNTIVQFLAHSPAQQITLTINILGLVFLSFHWTGISKKLKGLIDKNGQSIDETMVELRNKVNKLLQREDQQVVIILDTSSDMDTAGKFFQNKWIDLVFHQTAALSFIFDDDGHIPVYLTRNGNVKKLNYLLTEKNANEFVEKFVGRNTEGQVQYAPALKEVFTDYAKKLTNEHDPVLVIFITAGGGKDLKETMTVFKQVENKPIFVQFLAIHGDKPHENIGILEKIAADPGDKIDNSGISSLPLFRLTDANQIVEDILNEYPEYLKKAEKLGFIQANDTHHTQVCNL